MRYLRTRFPGKPELELSLDVLQYLVERPPVLVVAPRFKKPSFCPYCSSSAVVVVEPMATGWKVVGAFSVGQEDTPMLCMCCRRIWSVTLAGTE